MSRTWVSSATVAVVLLVGSACYHATIETGAAPSTQVVEQKWAAGWLWGLIPPSPVNVASQCTNGVSRVETRWSFLNGLVNALTGGIFTPMEITVTCAAGGSAMSALPADAHVIAYVANRPGALEEALTTAFQVSVEESRPVYLIAH